MNFGNAIFNLFIKKLKKALETYYNEKKEFYDTVIEVNKIKGIFCERKWIGEIILKIVFLLLIFSFFWLLVDTIYNLYIYLKMSSFLMVKSNPRLDDNPLFIQIKKLTYFNSYFSIDLLFLIFATTPIFILIKLWILELGLQGIDKFKNTFQYTKWYCYLIMIFAVIYYLIVYKNITALGKRVNVINTIIYNNINADFINSQKICNYLKKKSEYDYEFVYGKCNDIRNNISINKLYNYIKKLTLEIQQNIAPIGNISIEKFKLLKDKNGKLYKDKIISAFFTFQLVKYFINNDLIDEAKNFFATYNILYLSKIDLLRNKINPILYLRYDNLILFNDTFEYNSQMANSFGNNKNIYNYVYNEVNKNQNTIQNLVLEIYNICSYKLLSVYLYYFIMFLILVIFIIVYIYYI
jgi:hypothetical protein